ncbi:hypothetical protein K239x_33070 [Planctomycetes bacterium K23_9]|uniref:Uncharacterized protein n=1 Tax=Stieleria marina TaxID=1930275 RepID=A0A517NW06_9BACT|nr:hypothetical protein K239x_33070 [Planctomycetes bacterium K23_9]
MIVTADAELLLERSQGVGGIRRGQTRFSVFNRKHQSREKRCRYRFIYSFGG